MVLHADKSHRVTAEINTNKTHYTNHNQMDFKMDFTNDNQANNEIESGSASVNYLAGAADNEPIWGAKPRPDEEDPLRPALQDTEGGRFLFFIKTYGILFFNFLVSMIGVYVLTDTNVLFASKSRTTLATLCSWAGGVISYLVLYYSAQRGAKLILPVQAIALYVYIAAASIQVVLMSKTIVLPGAIVMYGLVAVCCGLLASFLHAALSKCCSCIKQGGKLWVTLATAIGVACACIYSVIAVYSGSRPFLLPPAMLNKLITIAEVTHNGQKQFSLWRRILLVAGSSVLSGGFLAFITVFAAWYTSRNTEALNREAIDNFSLWVRFIVHLYVYISIPLVAVAVVIKKLVMCIRKRKNGEGEPDEI